MNFLFDNKINEVRLGNAGSYGGLNMWNSHKEEKNKLEI